MKHPEAWADVQSKRSEPAPRFFPTNGGETVTRERVQYFPIWTLLAHQSVPVFRCQHCNLEQRDHINSLYCPEWRLRQKDGDR